jgi:hypothetical protein
VGILASLGGGGGLWIPRELRCAFLPFHRKILPSHMLVEHFVGVQFSVSESMNI